MQAGFWGDPQEVIRIKQIIPEIYVRDCQNALQCYKSIFGGKIKNLQLSDNMEMFSHLKNKVIHSELHVNGRCVLYFVDALEKKRDRPGNITVMLHLDSEEEIARVYRELIRGGRVSMALQRTRSGGRHAIVTDRYGAPWALNYTRS